MKQNGRRYFGVLFFSFVFTCFICFEMKCFQQIVGASELIKEEEATDEKSKSAEKKNKKTSTQKRKKSKKLKKDKESKEKKKETKGNHKGKETEKEKEQKKIAKPEVKYNGKKVYLTFDDGPSENTDEILKILEQYGVKGTFFVIGKEDEAAINRYKTIVEKGHTIGLHSYTHNYKQIYANLEAFKKDYDRIQNLIKKVTGITSTYYRFPGGSSNTVSPISMKVFVDYFNEIGIRYYDWNVQAGDAVRIPPSPQTLYNNVIRAISNSKQASFIVLIHDSKPMKNSVKALPLILDWLKKYHYEILPIDDETIQIHHRIAK